MTDQCAPPALKMEALCSPETLVSCSQGYTLWQIRKPRREQSPHWNVALCVCVCLCRNFVQYHLAYPPRRESSGGKAGDPIVEANPGTHFRRQIQGTDFRRQIRGDYFWRQIRGPTSGGKSGTRFWWQIRGPTSVGKSGAHFWRQIRGPTFGGKFGYSLIIIIYCNWVVTRWQWLFYMYTKYEIGNY